MDRKNSQYEQPLPDKSDEAVEHSPRGSIDVVSHKSVTNIPIPSDLTRQSSQVSLLSSPDKDSRIEETSSNDSTDGSSTTSSLSPSSTWTARPNLLHSFLSFLNDWWFWEVCGIILGSSCITAIVIVLVRTDNDAISEWAFSIQPNTLVSIFMTIAKPALMVPISQSISQSKWLHFKCGPQKISDFQHFDDASKGPWGAFQLLLTMKTRSPFASWGAFMMLAAMALDPFAQQIIAYPSRHVPLANGYARINATQRLAFQGDPNNKSVLDVDTQNAIINGTFNLNSSNLFGCPTSRCKWTEQFLSLGVCSSCRKSHSNKQPECGTAVEENGIKTYHCNHTLPEITIPILVQYQGLGLHDWTKVLTILKNNTIQSGNRSEPSPNQCLTQPEAGLRCLASFAHCNANREEAVGKNGLQYDITECDIYWCAHVFESAEFNNGTFTPELNGSYVLKEWPALTEEFKTDLDPSYMPRFPNQSVYMNLSNYTGGHETLVVDSYQHNAIVRYLSEVFSVNQSAKGRILQTDIGQTNGNRTVTGRIYPVLAKTNNVTDVVENIAASLTNRIRNANSNRPVYGTAYRSETYIHVRWAWAVLPLSLLTLTVLYLACSIRQNRKSGTVLWKSSSMALLFHELEGWDKDKLAVADMEELQQAVVGMRARLGRDANGMLKFVRA